MFRKLWMPVAAVATVVVGLAAAPEASADWGGRHGHEHRPVVVVHERHHRDFHVYYRGCAHEPWVSYSRCFDCLDSAERVACRLRARGFEVFIR